ncbi:trypsin-like peptidase domain-containing protein [Streptomyces sp. NPDC058441]|uniref:nSTAND1 domain-containing NTPase n=1 Tax=Streptomyces sp. NPDC058441 TaxID=3346502 RepID=UPI00366761E2
MSPDIATPHRDPDPSFTPQSAVAQVLSPKGEVAGAAFLAAEDVVFTCAHVVRSAGYGPGDVVRLLFPRARGAPQAEGEVLAEPWRPPEDEDVAVIRLRDTPSAVHPLGVGAAAGSQGHRVRSYGFPAQAPPGGHFGYGTAGDLLGGDRLQVISNDLTAGFSGTPLVDDVTGLVIGMVTAIAGRDPNGRGQNIAYATPTETLRRLWPDLALKKVRPYRGLEPFGQQDARWFHGRDEARDAVLASLRRNRRGVLLLGPSGSGKSSLVQAGVLPNLPAGWKATLVRPVTGLPDIPAAEQGTQLLVVIDQFEELLTPAEPDLPTLQRLTELATSYQPVTILLVMRDDFYPRLAELAPDLLKALQPGLLNIPATLSENDLKNIITKPAATAGACFEKGLPARIIVDLLRADDRNGPSGRVSTTLLPLLEKTLTLLWEQREDNRLTSEAYKAIGTLKESLATWRDTAFAEFTPRQRAAAERILSALVRHDETRQTPDTRQRRSLTDLRALAGDPESDTALAVLARHRIITTYREEAELIHDTLIRDWPDLQTWVERDAKFHAWLRRARAQADRGPLQGVDLEEGLDYGEQGRGLPPDVADLLAASRRHRQLRRARAIIVLSSVLAVVVALASVAFVQLQREQTAKQRADAAKRRAESAASAAVADDLITQADRLANWESNPWLALQLASAAVRVHDSPKTRAGLVTLLTTTALVETHRAQIVGFRKNDEPILDEDPLLAVAPNGRTQAKMEGKGISVEGGPVFDKTGSLVEGISFAADSKRLAVGHGDGTMTVWDVSDPDKPRPIGGPVFVTEFDPDDVQFSPDGRMIAVATSHGVTLWTADAPHRKIAVPRLPASVLDALDPDGFRLAFQPGGHQLVAATKAGVVRWDITDPRHPRSLGDPLNGDVAAAFNPNGQVLATSSSTNGVFLWDNTDPSKPRYTGTIPAPQDHGTEDFMYSPDGRRLAVNYSGEHDRSYVWNLARDRPLQPLGKGIASTGLLAVRPDGRALITRGKGDRLHYWDISDPARPVQLTSFHPSIAGGVSALAFDPKGKTLAIGSRHGRVQLWDVSHPANPAMQRAPQNWLDENPEQRLPGDENTGPKITGLSFSEGGRTLDILGQGQLAQWNMDHDTVPLLGPDENGSDIASFSDQTDMFAKVSVAYEGAAPRLLLFRPNTGEAEDLTGGGSTGSALQLSPNGRLLAVGGDDGTLTLWATDGHRGTSHRLNAPATGHATAVSAVAFSPDDSTVATAAEDGTVIIWAATRDGVFPLTGAPVMANKGGVDTMGFTPDGRTLLTTGSDGKLRRWDVAPIADIRKDPVKQACTLGGGGLGKDDWASFIPSLPYRDTCSP